MNRFHGIQQDREQSYVPSFPYDSASSGCEGDADNDSFETAASLLNKKNELPFLGYKNSIARSRDQRQQLRSKIESESCGMGSDVELAQMECAADGREEAVSLIDTQEEVVNKEERHTETEERVTERDRDFYDKIIIVRAASGDKSSARLAIEAVLPNLMDDCKADADSSSIDCTACDTAIEDIAETASPESIARKPSSDPSTMNSTACDTAIEDISETASPRSIARKPSFSRSIGVASPPKLEKKVIRSENFLFGGAVASSYQAFKMRNESESHLEFSPCRPHPPFVGCTIPSPVHSNSSTCESSFSTVHPRDPTDCTSVPTFSDSKRITEIKSRLRNIEGQHRRSSTRTISSSTLLSSQRDLNPSTLFSSIQNVNNAHRIAREILIVSFSAFVIYVGYLTHRDAQSNGMQLQLTKIHLMERSLELTSSKRLTSIKIHKENIELLRKTFAIALELKQRKTEQSCPGTGTRTRSTTQLSLGNDDHSSAMSSAMEQISNPAAASTPEEELWPITQTAPLLGSDEHSSSMSLAMEQSFSPAVAPTPAPHSLVSLDLPSLCTQLLQKLSHTIGMHIEPLQEMDPKVMQDFFYVQSMLD